MKTFTEGDSFGDYRVVRRLGKGGMGEVWLLRSPSGEEVAAKILDDSSSADHEARKRFLREAELAMAVKHPNLVETYDVGEDPDTGLCYILMEYMPGGTLADYIKYNGALDIDDAVAVVSAIATALELARQKGIVHRDIKPANIMFDMDGTPKLADLGIARSGASDSDTTTLTQTGVMIGTPAYMAPEQMLDAHHVDTRADIYSLGVVFYEMLTGERPNKDDTVVQILARAVKGEPIPDMRTLRPEVSASLAQLLNMMVVPDKDIVFHIRNYDEEGRWKMCSGRLWNVNIGEISGSADRCSFFIYPYEFMDKGFGVSFSHSRWETYDDYGEISKDTFDLLAKGGKLPSPRRLERGNTYPMHVCFQPGHVYRLILKEPQRVASRNGRKPYDIDFLVYVDPLTTGIGHADAALVNIASTRTSKPKSDKNAVGNAVQKASDAKSTDRSPRHAKIDGTTWTYRIVDGCAFLMCAESRALLSVPCVDPAPKGVLKIRYIGEKDEQAAERPAKATPKNTAVNPGKPVVLFPRLDRDPTAWAYSFEERAGWKDASFDDSTWRRAVVFCPRSRKSYTFPAGIEDIYAGAFLRAHLKQIIIPETVKFVGHDAFNECPFLESVRFSGDDAIIRGGAFGNLPSLKTVVLPKRLKALDDWAIFCRAGQLESITLPDTVEIIDDAVFEGCPNLKAVKFPATLNELGAEVFLDCGSLKSVTFAGDAPRLSDQGAERFGKDLYKGTDKSLVTFVSKGSAGWQDETGRLPKSWRWMEESRHGRSCAQNDAVRLA